jgi:predicted RNA-binding Zn ribbon-like protein
VAVDPFDAGRQPAGRAPAPGRLAFVQAFLNTFWDLDAHGGDGWSDARAYGAWLRDRGFDGRAPGERDRGLAIELREALRALAHANHDAAPDPEAEAALDRIAVAVSPRAGLAPRFGGPAGDRLEVTGRGPEDALALALGIVLAARADGSWTRLKACPHEHCGWAFYDRSRNRSSQWCSMRICGNRTKAARHRSRQAA